MLAAVIEIASGMRFSDYVQQNIFEPLGMTKTLVRDDPRVIIPNRVNSYSDNGYEFKNTILNLQLLKEIVILLIILMRQFAM